MRERGRVVDFVWRSASNAAAHLLHRDPYELIGKRMRDIEAAGPLGHPALIDRHRRVLDPGHALSFEQMHVAAGRQAVASRPGASRSAAPAASAAAAAN